MKMFLDRKALCLGGAALLLTCGVTVGRAMAYFTTYAEASGGGTVSLGFTETVPNEKVVDWTKEISIENQGDYDCFVRVKIFAGAKYQEGLEISGEGWSKGENDYYYYKDVIPAGGTTPDHLLAKIDNMESTEDFNVIVVQESAPVLYDENGSPYVDWNVVLDSVQDQYH